MPGPVRWLELLLAGSCAVVTGGCVLVSDFDGLSTAGTDCDEATGLHFDEPSGRCYRLDSGPLAWAAAEAECQAWGGHLISLASPDFTEFSREEQLLKDILTEGGGVGAWIGASDVIVEGEFTWSSGELWTFDEWGANAPSDPAGTKDCVFHGPPGDFPWTDYDCSLKQSYVCER